MSKGTFCCRKAYFLTHKRDFSIKVQELRKILSYFLSGRNFWCQKVLFAVAKRTFWSTKETWASKYKKWKKWSTTGSTVTCRNLCCSSDHYESIGTPGICWSYNVKPWRSCCKNNNFQIVLFRKFCTNIVLFVPPIIATEKNTLKYV